MAIDAVHEDLCNGCGICVRNCPMDVLRMDTVTRRPRILYREDCMLCGQCLECPKDAVALTPGFVQPMTLGWG